MTSSDPAHLPIPYKLILFLLAVLGSAGIILATSRYGAGLSPDSVGYIGTARNLVRGEGFTNYDGTPTVVWPPLYAALLALAGSISGIDPLRLANLLNALLFGLIVYAAGVLFYRHFSAFPALALAGALAVLASSALFGVAVMAWSEPLFILWVVLSLISIDTYLTKKDLASLFYLSTWVAFACLTRYIGMTLILWAAPLILLGGRGRLKQRLAHLACFVSISGLQLGAWLIRNYIVSHTFFGDRAASAFTLSQNFTLAYKKVLEWYLPGAISSRRPLLILIGLGLVLLTGLSLWNGWQGWKARLRTTGPVFLFVIIYACFLLISSTVTAYDLMDHRLLSPLVVPLTLLLFTLFQAACGPFRKRFSPKWVQAVLIASVGLWLTYPIRSTVLDAVHLYPRGEGYASKEWMDSETVQYILQRPKQISKCTFYTNDTVGAYIRADLATQRSPAKSRYNSPEVVTTLASLQGSWPEETNACLVWFNQVNRSFLFTPRELGSIASLTPLVQFADGAVYTVTKK